MINVRGVRGWSAVPKISLKLGVRDGSKSVQYSRIKHRCTDAGGELQEGVPNVHQVAPLASVLYFWAE